MSKKRRREQPTVDVQLVEIYEDLANVDEPVRLKAAHALLTNFVNVDAATGDQLNEILRRLIRGLCSGRKAARLGFSIALTEILIQLLGPKPSRHVPGLQSITDLISTLVNQTSFSGNVSGQEARDHQFGRLFGAESIIKSGILFQPENNLDSWNETLDLIYGLAEQKTWLREACGLVLCKAIEATNKQGSSYSQLIIDKLHQRMLEKTPEGIAMWIVVNKEGLSLNLPSQVWSHNDPLDRKEKSTLATILKDGAVEPPQDDEHESNVTQKGNWGSRMHFVWDVITERLTSAQAIRGRKKLKGGKTLSFEEFWEEAVDNSLFAPASSDERKYRGFWLFQTMVLSIPLDVLPNLFSHNFMRCLINQLGSPDRFLHRAARKSIKSAIERATIDSDSAALIVKALLTEPFGDINFDKITKTEAIKTIISQIEKPGWEQLTSVFEQLIMQSNAQEEKLTASMRLNIADQLSSALKSREKNEHVGLDGTKNEDFVVSSILGIFVKYAYFDLDNASQTKVNPPISQSTRQIFRTRISSCLNHLMAKSIEAHIYAYQLIQTIREIQRDPEHGKPLLEIDGVLSGTITKSFEILDKASLEAQEESHEILNKQYLRSITLLFSLTILQIYNEDPDSVTMLEELNDIFEEYVNKKSQSIASGALVDILLSYSSRQSQLFSRLAQQVFTSFATEIDEIGLQSMVKILEIKENLSGQAEVFEQQNDDENVSDESDDNSDVEEVDEVEAESTTSVSDDAERNSTDGAPGDADDPANPDEELAAFDAKLAQALGTRPGYQDVDAEDTNSSDDNMDDNQMEALDEHLANVFRERKELTKKRTENKDAKERIVNFKCRVLELLEIYVKRNRTGVLSLSLLTPILQVIRTTRSSLVSTKACKLMKKFSKLCKRYGLPKLEDADAMFKLLEQVHLEAGREASNAHSTACGQASLLIVRALVRHDRETLRNVDKIYAKTKEKILSDSSCKVKNLFFTDWDNWCSSAR